MVQDIQPIYQDNGQSTVNTTKKETNTQPRERSGTITQKSLNLSLLIVNDQHKLHNAIQGIPSTLEETIIQIR
ncbi:unnamed protein product [Cunninghamella blakesleeana]